MLLHQKNALNLIHFTYYVPIYPHKQMLKFSIILDRDILHFKNCQYIAYFHHSIYLIHEIIHSKRSPHNVYHHPSSKFPNLTSHYLPFIHDIDHPQLKPNFFLFLLHPLQFDINDANLNKYHAK